MHDRSKELASRKTGVNKTLEFLDSIESDIPKGKHTRSNAVGSEKVCMYVCMYVIFILNTDASPQS